MNQALLHLGRPTYGDPEFFSRWKQSLGVEMIYTDRFMPNKDVTIIATDQYTDITPSILENFPNTRYVCSPRS